MHKKPEGCNQCPLFGDGEGFVPDLLTKGAEVLVVSLLPSTYELRTGEPRNGMTIDQHARDYERYAGRTEMSYAHVIRCRGQQGTKLPSGKKLKDGAEFCRQYDKITDGTRLIVYNGKDVAKLLRPDVGYPDVWRGYILPERAESESI